ncbi:MAG: DUF2752 domain-containing protein [Bifidobacteriaceae bacterium]|nr:DUF2752 domain-containing protein [Bifidobacteriaceae bacterium]
MPAVVGFGGLAALTLLFAVDPNEPGHYPPCPLFAATGTYCPGCGTLRALHALLHFDVASAAHTNPAILVALPYLGTAFGLWVSRCLTGRPIRKRLAPAWALRVLVAAILAYWILRNVPTLVAVWELDGLWRVGPVTWGNSW